ncbi:hypothetical protein HBI75_138870 [Parastagonospora nodorum]|nr:hypothetical protein HBH49_102590 [Parastagonospora nodorum]KAH5026421.1 hypothetical protein HBI75_138870 [Parastagonospora nodorum]KAH5301117.1 hypothetical protein HBI11_141710 [Parastagonospora nodorum]KAH5520370.1 hypothetical protein HBI29_061670 [Parastagonospora nodorum]KAH6413561.1 hypothetical protein HBI14_130220 [Parastagonospora nodorum]
MDDGDDIDVSHDGSASKRACDSCRNRKIRCDRLMPCSNCKASKLTCTTTAPTQKSQRQRVHISEEYEKKIDRIEDRLAGIENVLASLATKLGDLDLRRDSTEISSQSRSSRRTAGRSPGTLEEAGTPAPFEGETAIASQSDYARELLRKAVGSTPSIEQNAEVKSALHALNELVPQQGQAPSSASYSLINHSFAELDPETLAKPPWDAVSNMVDEASKNPTMSLALLFPFLQMKNLNDIIYDAYYNPGGCGSTRRMLAYGIIHIIVEEYAIYPLEGMNKEDNMTYVSQCKLQMEVAVSQLDIFMVASYENIMALMLGGAWAVEMSRPSLTSVMVGTAARLCQTLGYHRYTTYANDTEEDRNSKLHIFWMIYMFDKTMSLRLGRASFIQDYDISLPFFGDSQPSPGSPDSKLMLSYWCKVARVQGQTYEKLFSPAAFLRTAEERTQTAIELVKAMNQAWYERGDARVSDMPNGHCISDVQDQHATTNFTGPNETELPSKRKRGASQSPAVGKSQKGTLAELEDVFFYSDVVMHYSTCSLIQRAVSPDNVTFNDECLESARAALVAHMRCNDRFNVAGNEYLWSGYIHWSILQAPFTPFIVIVCNLIQNTDFTDVPSLEDFVKSLEACRSLSEGADKLYKMCNLFLRVAKLYLQAKSQDNTTLSQTYSQSQPSYYNSADGSQFDPNYMTDFDPYLSALGLMPNSAWPMSNYGTAQAEGFETYTQSQNVGGVTGLEVPGMGLPGGGQHPVQDWFSGSRYLMGRMEAGDDLQMPDLDL